ncbi:cell surface glycoprotein 1-like [Topomyia yanbarensis]|uniref:cell surface glycoprotein 1-like n=1 Tax=Topomyia yanbarensis TaxID=2498891 RepID=UPI00273C928D|nr:cell surface glycoprotein 1-like [Topomyia yanbarensis]
MARYDGNRDLLITENETLQAQLQEAAVQLAELHAQLAVSEEIQNQLDNALQQINNRDQLIARLRATGNNDVESIRDTLKRNLRPTVDERDRTINALLGGIAKLKELVANRPTTQTKDTETERLKEELISTKKENKELRNELAALRKTVEELKKHFMAKKAGEPIKSMGPPVINRDPRAMSIDRMQNIQATLETATAAPNTTHSNNHLNTNKLISHRSLPGEIVPYILSETASCSVREKAFTPAPAPTGVVPTPVDEPPAAAGVGDPALPRTTHPSALTPRRQRKESDPYRPTTSTKQPTNDRLRIVQSTEDIVNPIRADPLPYPLWSLEGQPASPPKHDCQLSYSSTNLSSTKHDYKSTENLNHNITSETVSRTFREKAFSPAPALTGVVPTIVDEPPAAAGAGDPACLRVSRNTPPAIKEPYSSESLPDKQTSKGNRHLLTNPSTKQPTNDHTKSSSHREPSPVAGCSWHPIRFHTWQSTEFASVSLTRVDLPNHHQQPHSPTGEPDSPSRNPPGSLSARQPRHKVNRDIQRQTAHQNKPKQVKPHPKDSTQRSPSPIAGCSRHPVTFLTRRTTNDTPVLSHRDITNESHPVTENIKRKSNKENAFSPAPALLADVPDPTDEPSTAAGAEGPATPRVSSALQSTPREQLSAPNPLSENLCPADVLDITRPGRRLTGQTHADPLPHPRRSPKGQSVCQTEHPTEKQTAISEIDSCTVREKASSPAPALTVDVPVPTEEPPAAANAAPPGQHAQPTPTTDIPTPSASLPADPNPTELAVCLPSPFSGTSTD